LEENEKKAILERREAHRKLSEIILAGTEYSEKVVVKGIDGKDYEVTVYAVSDEDYRRAIKIAGMDSKELLDRNAVLAHWGLANALAPIATRDPEICKVIKPAQSFRILEKVIAISDFPFRAPTNVRTEPVQPTA